MIQCELSDELIDYLAECYQAKSKVFKQKYDFIDYAQYCLKQRREKVEALLW